MAGPMIIFRIRDVTVRQHTQDIYGCPWLSVSTHRTSVAVRVCPSAHTGRWWLSISTHISTLVLGLSTLVLGLSTLALPVDCLGDFGPRGLSVQYTHDVRGCSQAYTGRPWLSVAHTGCPWLSVCVRVWPWVSASTHMTSVAVHQHTQDVRVCPSAHTGRPCVSLCVRQHTQDFRGCPSVYISGHWSLDSVRPDPGRLGRGRCLTSLGLLPGRTS